VRSGTVDRIVGVQPADAAGAGRTLHKCALARWQHFSSSNDVMVAIMKSLVSRHIRNPTPSIDAYLRRTILPNFIPIRFETTEPWSLWKTVTTNKKSTTRKTTRRIATCDQFLILKLTGKYNDKPTGNNRCTL